MTDFVRALLEPWPWYVAGPVIGLTVPLLLILGNKNLFMVHSAWFMEMQFVQVMMNFRF